MLSCELTLASIALARFSKVLKIYRPFLVIAMIGFVLDAVAVVLAYTIRNNLPCSNIYVLLELLFFIWQFCEWGTIPRTWAMVVLLLVVPVWFIEVFVYTTIWGFAGVYRTVYAFVIVLLAVWQMNKLLVNEKTSIHKNPVFIICSAWIYYYTIKCTVEVLYMLQNAFAIHVWSLLATSNIIVVIIYTVAVLRMPKRKAFVLQKIS